MQFEDLHELTSTLNAVTEATKSLDAADAKIDAAPSSAEEADANVRARAARQGTDMCCSYARQRACSHVKKVDKGVLVTFIPAFFQVTRGYSSAGRASRSQ